LATSAVQLDLPTLEAVERPARRSRSSSVVQSPSSHAVLVLKRVNARHDDGMGAGAYRNTDLVDPKDVLQRRALKAAQVQRREQVIFGALERENNLKGLSREKFAERATHYLAQIVEWSPFHRKNVETAIGFVRELGHSAGFNFSVRKADPKKLQAALVSAVTRNDQKELGRIVEEGTRYSRAVAFEDAMQSGDRAPALTAHPDLKHAFAVVDRPLARNPKSPQSALASSQKDHSLINRVQRMLDRGGLTKALTPAEQKTLMGRGHGPAR
jgi:fido (protein-threonine AMPylation protein)